MHLIRTVFALVLLLTAVPAVYAENVASDSLKVGFVNIRKLISQAPQLTDIRKKLAAEFEPENKAIIKLREEISALNVVHDGANEKAQLLALQKKVTQKQTELARLQQALQDEYNLRRNEALGGLQTLIVQMVARVSKEKKLDIVLNNTGVIYVSSRIDITADVLRYLSEQLVE
ncbi:MAG: hypothetical protein CSA44_02090 [Gammaproteobacteria bacterium]|nr:MAG: hypothetical protein CSA44_02090 [Gammaproteobacteria bacterium]